MKNENSMGANSSAAKLDDSAATKGPRIVTECICPPVPSRQFDYQAVREDYDEGDLIGFGPTKEAAIANLIEQENDR